MAESGLKDPTGKSDEKIYEKVTYGEKISIALFKVSSSPFDKAAILKFASYS